MGTRYILGCFSLARAASALLNSCVLCQVGPAAARGLITDQATMVQAWMRGASASSAGAVVCCPVQHMQVSMTGNDPDYLGHVQARKW